MTEEWKPVPGYEGRFLASNLGRIKRIARLVTYTKTGTTYPCPEKIMSLIPDKDRYLRVFFRISGKGFFVPAHRMVALAFHGEPNEGLQVNHINGDKQDNKPCNLEWVTVKENIRHAVRSGLRRTGSGWKKRSQTKEHKATSSQFRGVRRRKEKCLKKFVVQGVNKDGGKLWIGFENEEEAARAYDRYALRIYGQDAILNFPRSDYE